MAGRERDRGYDILKPNGKCLRFDAKSNLCFKVAAHFNYHGMETMGGYNRSIVVGGGGEGERRDERRETRRESRRDEMRWTSSLALRRTKSSKRGQRKGAERPRAKEDNMMVRYEQGAGRVREPWLGLSLRDSQSSSCNSKTKSWS